MYQFNSEIDGLLANLTRRKPNATGLFRGGGLPKGGGLSGFRGGGIPRLKSGIPDGGFKKRPKMIREEMRRTDNSAAATTAGAPIAAASGSDSGSDADSESDSDAGKATISGRNSALGQPVESKASSSQPSMESAASSQPSEQFAGMTPATKGMYAQAVAGVPDNAKEASREDVNYFVRPAGTHVYLHLAAGNKKAREVLGDFIGQPKAVTPWHFQGASKQAHEHEKPRELKGALQGYTILAVRGDRGRQFAKGLQTAAEWKVQQRGSGWTPPKEQLKPQRSSSSSASRRLPMDLSGSS